MLHTNMLYNKICFTKIFNSQLLTKGIQYAARQGIRPNWDASTYWSSILLTVLLWAFKKHEQKCEKSITVSSSSLRLAAIVVFC